jgi:hypothetical protein
MAERTLLDIVSGGRVKHTGVGKYKGLPGASPVVPALFSQLYRSMAEYQEREMSKEVIPAGKNIFGQHTEPITQGNLYEMTMGVAGVGAVVKTASTARKLFSGWADNLRTYMATASKRESKLQKYILNKAMPLVDNDDIKATQSALNAINKEFGLKGKVTVPKIEGAAGGKIKQAAKPKGSQIKEDVPGTKWRKKAEAKAKTAKKKLKESGDEPYSPMTRKYG